MESLTIPKPGRSSSVSLTPTGYLFVGFFVVVMLAGGASRADAVGQIFVRLAACVMIATALITRGWALAPAARAPALLLAALALIIAVQLIPLPPGLWWRLPGREEFRTGLEAIGLANVWRPASLTPDATLNSLLSILPAIATCLGMSAIPSSARPRMALVILIAVAASALLGVLQITTGSGYTGSYRDIVSYRHEGLAVGAFANRNHEAVFLVCALPLLAWWASTAPARSRRPWLAFLLAVTLFPLILITGSRAGLLIGVVAAAASAALALSGRSSAGPGSKQGWLPVYVGAAIAALVGIIFVIGARDLALQRLLQSNVSDDVRFNMVPVFWRIIVDYLPVGTGFGAFDPVFRHYEPFGALKVAYLNHAHDDLIELVIEAGSGGVILIVAGAVWLVAALRRAFFSPVGARDTTLARAMSLVVLILLIGSLVDYPVRTPILSVVLTIAAILITPQASSARLRASR